MAMNGPVKIIAVLLSLMVPIATFTDHFYRPTTRPLPRPHMGDTSARNRYPDADEQFVHPTRVGPRSANNDRRGQIDDDHIIYPDTNKNPSCTHGLCVNVAGYPKEQIQKLLTRAHFVNGFFEATEELISVDNRFNTDEMPLCETKVHTIYPEKANNTMKIEKVIVNVEGHKQGIVFETCVNNGKCKFSSNFPTGYTSFCKQKYIRKRLMVLGDNDKFVFDSFEVPSCCVCTVNRTD